ncbi:hypothetical protein OG879_28840 [Streptomyces caniferus]|uniref:hypothetical protein n=1 Tax=Streptomyces caniferus TaxID=285557 RepID=UPI002E2B08EE|nr:hypothetical protein [Streptomyces caniferus]
MGAEHPPLAGNNHGHDAQAHHGEQDRLAESKGQDGEQPHGAEQRGRVGDLVGVAVKHDESPGSPGLVAPVLVAGNPWVVGRA